MQRKLFRSKEYASLKANEKFLLFWFAHLTNENTQSYKRKAKEFLGQYSSMLGVSKRVVRSYMHTLKNFFATGLTVYSGTPASYVITFFSANPLRAL